jgi:hypothetical protein
MTRNAKAAVFLGCGFLSVMLGAMPLCGYIGFLLAPSDFHRDAFTGSIPLWLAGLVSWLAGIVLITCGSDRPLRVLAIWLVGLAGGLFLNLPSLYINPGGDREAAIGWAALVSVGVACAVAARSLRNLVTKRLPRTPGT